MCQLCTQMSNVNLWHTTGGLVHRVCDSCMPPCTVDRRSLQRGISATDAGEMSEVMTVRDVVFPPSALRICVNYLDAVFVVGIRCIIEHGDRVPPMVTIRLHSPLAVFGLHPYIRIALLAVMRFVQGWKSVCPDDAACTGACIGCLPPGQVWIALLAPVVSSFGPNARSTVTWYAANAGPFNSVVHLTTAILRL